MNRIIRTPSLLPAPGPTSQSSKHTNMRLASYNNHFRAVGTNNYNIYTITLNNNKARPRQSFLWHFFFHWTQRYPGRHSCLYAEGATPALRATHPYGLSSPAFQQWNKYSPDTLYGATQHLYSKQNIYFKRFVRKYINIKYIERTEIFYLLGALHCVLYVRPLIL